MTELLVLLALGAGVWIGRKSGYEKGLRDKWLYERLSNAARRARLHHRTATLRREHRATRPRGH